MTKIPPSPPSSRRNVMNAAELPSQRAIGSLPVAPSMSPTLEAQVVRVPEKRAVITPRVLLISGLAIVLAAAASLVARALTALIGLITNLAFYGRLSGAFVSPSANTLGLWVIVIPAIGGLVVGLMARYGSAAIRGHGIPEAMEKVLFAQSKIPVRMTFLKPLSAAIAIGTGGPFGAEGPIIATGGALGSFIGQTLKVSADERKTLLAAGAAAGMSATFGSPVAAVLLAIELLLFEYRIRSLVPVALASATACGMKIAFTGSDAAFHMPDLPSPTGTALAVYIAIGAAVGLASTGVTRAVYWIEDAFEKLPVHWMWWPAFGGLAVGLVGYFAPATLGVGYVNIDHLLSGDLAGRAAIVFCVLKFISWSISLGSGTSGGTLAPMLTIGGGIGTTLGLACAAVLPGHGIDPRVAALVGMAALFAGASRALLASVVFAFETTRQTMGLLPLLGGCTTAFMVSSLLMRHSIMTEKIARRGARVVQEYSADFLDQVLVRDYAAAPVVALVTDDSLAHVREWLASGETGTKHQGFPVLDESGVLRGVVTRRDLLDSSAPGDRHVEALIKRPPAVVYDDSTLREAADHMIAEGVGRLPVVTRADPQKPIGMITRSDLLTAHGRRLEDTRPTQPRFDVKRAIKKAARGALTP